MGQPAGNRRRFIYGAAAAAAAAAVGIPLARRGGSGAAPLVVGGLPVTCNLTLPIACHSRELAAAAGQVSGQGFTYNRFNGWPEIKEAMLANKIQAGYMLAPMIMDLASKKVPVKIVSLGHRSGAVIMVRKDSGFTTFKQLAGKRVAIPSRFAVDYLFLRKMLKAEDMTPKDVEIVEMPPPDMPAALYANAIEAYCTGEPFGAAAQRAGYAVPLRMTRDEWPSYICCCLTVREELVQTNRPLVQELVNTILGAGQWLDAEQGHRTKAAEIAAGRSFFNQDKNIIQFVMENPTDRVTYGDLRMVPSEFDDIMRQCVEAGTLKSEVPFEQYIDQSFVQAAKPASILA